MPHLYDSTNIPNIQFLEQGSTPSTPAANFWRLYFKAGGLYMIDDAGVETQIVTSPWSTAAGLTRLGTTTDNVTIGSATAGGKLFVDGDADEIQLQVQANATQTALLAVFEDSAGNDVLTVAGLGGLVVNEQGNDTDSRIEGDNDANLLFLDASADRVGIGNAAPTARFMIDGRADEIQALIQGHSTQTSLLMVLEDSAGNDLVTISGLGAVVINEQGNDADFRVEGDTDANLLFLDASVDRAAIGSTTLNAKFNVQSSDLMPFEAVTEWSSSVNSNLMATFTAYGDNPRFTCRRANGTIASPTQVLSGETFGNFNFRGYGSTAFPANADASITALARENFTDSARGTSLRMTMTELGAITSPTYVLELYADKTQLRAQDTITNAVTNALLIAHHTTSAAAAGFGTGLLLRGKSSNTDDREMGRLRFHWTTATDASRKARGTLSAYDTAERDCIMWEADGSAAMLGFYGTAPIVKPAPTGSRGGNAALASLLTALANLGLITDSTSA